MGDTVGGFSDEAVAARGPVRITRAVVAVVAVAAWFATQALLETRGFPGQIGDALHQALAPANHWLAGHPRATDALLIATSGFIDAFGCFLLLSGILGKTIRPFLGLALLAAVNPPADQPSDKDG